MQIKELTLNTKRLREQRTFYSEVLGLPIIDESVRGVSFKIGNSELRFEERSNTRPYHFAINIPSNKIDQALEWLKAKVEILKFGKNEIHNFDSWNARAVYFYDMDKNIVEFIARKNLNTDTNKPFDCSKLIEISEIGLPTTDIAREFKILNERTGIKIFDGNFESFCAIGDEHGLLICVNKEKRNWFPTGDKAYSSDFKIRIVENAKEYELHYQNGILYPVRG